MIVDHVMIVDHAMIEVLEEGMIVDPAGMTVVQGEEMIKDLPIGDQDQGN